MISDTWAYINDGDNLAVILGAFIAVIMQDRQIKSTRRMMTRMFDSLDTQNAKTEKAHNKRIADLHFNHGDALRQRDKFQDLYIEEVGNL